MKYTFVKLREKRYEDSKGSWYLRIANSLEAMEYGLTGRKPLVESAFKNYFDVAGNKLKHFTNRTAVVANMKAEMKNTSVIEELGNFETLILRNIFHLLDEGYIVYVNSNGGYMMDDGDKNYETLETLESDRMIFPSNHKISITQWEGGKHWYAKVGNTEVVVDGERKWNTYEYAEKMANKFLKGMKNEE